MSKIIKLPEVIEYTALSRSSIYAYIQQNKFPAPIRLGKRAVGWSMEAIQKWVGERSQAIRPAQQGGSHE